MSSRSWTICGQCRISVLRYWLTNTHTTFVRRPQLVPLTRTHGLSIGSKVPFGVSHLHTNVESSPGTKKPHFSQIIKRRPIRYIDANDRIRDRLKFTLRSWIGQPAIRKRLEAINVPWEHGRHLIATFIKEEPRRPGGWFPREEDERWQLDRVAEEMAEDFSSALDGALTRRFMAWAVETLKTRDLAPPEVLISLSSVQAALDYSHPANWYPDARRLRRRIHMHVGPTNSGKTHTALRALAAAPRGIYASPLRLLAFEIYDRLNKGKIVPLGAENEPPEKHVRKCNMVTGEESRIVDEFAGLLSCTIEMIGLEKYYDVAVIDEVQMLTDPERGGAWTAAVLGICATEIHLCGEEGAVPLVQKMLKDTGDEVIIHRYERLSPLVVAEDSLNGDFRNIQKGDCIVTFTRRNVFALRDMVEKATDMKCAVIYGRLPPEVRSAQAELFNDPNSGYDVLIGSDAIGMGLNLRIKRIVFESTMKWNGKDDIQLSLSQLKQIAGRAGRYGLHGNSSAGIVTTLHGIDLPVVRKAVELRTIPSLKRAVLPSREQDHQALEQILKPPVLFSTAFDIQKNASILSSCYRVWDIRTAMSALEIIDTFCGPHTLRERMSFFLAPTFWNDDTSSKATIHMLKMYRDELSVDLLEACKDSTLLERFSTTQKIKAMDNANTAKVPENTLESLEVLYRIVIVYLWFHVRDPMAFHMGKVARQMKADLEETIQWTLQHMASSTKKLRRKFVRTGKQMDGVSQSNNFKRRPLYS